MPHPAMPRATLLLTRPEPQSRAFAARLGTVPGLDILISPLLKIVFSETLPDLPEDAGVIFTSTNGVAAWQALGGPILSPCFAVGAATAKAATEAGFTPRSAEGDAEALIALIRSEAPTGPLLHARGAHVSTPLADRLTDAGHPCVEAILYDQRAIPLSDPARTALLDSAPILVPLFSPRTARQFALDAPQGAKPVVVAMSDAVVSALGNFSAARVTRAAHPDAGAMLDALRAELARLGMLEGDRTGL